MVDNQTTKDSGITVQDISMVVQIMDLASSRGAFRGAELTQVGAVFDKLNGFLTKAAEEQKAKEEAQQAAQSQQAQQAVGS